MSDVAPKFIYIYLTGMSYQIILDDNEGTRVKVSYGTEEQARRAIWYALMRMTDIKKRVPLDAVIGDTRTRRTYRIGHDPYFSYGYLDPRETSVSTDPLAHLTFSVFELMKDVIERRRLKKQYLDSVTLSPNSHVPLQKDIPVSAHPSRKDEPHLTRERLDDAYKQYKAGMQKRADAGNDDEETVIHVDPRPPTRRLFLSTQEPESSSAVQQGQSSRSPPSRTAPLHLFRRTRMLFPSTLDK